MDIQIPVAPAGVLTLLSVLAPFAVALINHPSWKAGSKRLVATVVSIVLTGVVLAWYYVLTGDLVPAWPALLLLAIVVQQAAFTLLWKAVKDVEGRHGVK